MLNKVILIGRSSNKPSFKESPNGVKYCAFSIATNSGYGDKKQTDWHDITAFGKLAEVCSQYIEKGTMVYVEGRIQYSTYEKDGQRHKSTKIIASDVTLLSPKSGNDSAKGNQQTSNQKVVEQAMPEDNPFINDPIMDGIPF